MLPSDADRLAALERAVLDLRRDVQDLRAALAAAHPAEAPAPSGPAVPRPTAPAAPTPAPTAVPLSRRPTLGGRAAAYARTQLAGLSGAASAPGPDGPGPDGPGPDLEAVVGRYGTVAVAALLILMAVGAFLTWAIATFTISPAARVAVGAVGAAALATVGLWLRQRGAATSRANALTPADSTAEPDVDTGEGTQRFGDVLLALALAVTHVVAWAAGPFLGIVPPPLALAGAAAASGALAALAWHAQQQPLFLVGVGGALVAPFVTSGITGNATSLRIYGWLVLSSALLAIPTDPDVAPRWRGAVRLLGLGGALYTAAHLQDALAVATIGDPAGLGRWSWTLRRDLPALFALACAAVPLARTAWWARAGAEGRPTDAAVATILHAQLTFAYLAAAIGALMAIGVNTAGGAPPLVVLALLATLAAYATLHQLRSSTTTAPAPPSWYVAPFVRITPAALALAYPLLLLAAALLALPEIVGPLGAATAATWGVLAALAGWRANAHAPTRDRSTALVSAHAATAGLATALVPIFLFTGHDVVRVTLLAAHAAATVHLLRTLRHPLALLAPALVASVAAAWAWVLLGNRPAYAYTPFLTPGSFAAAAVVVAWSIIAIRVWRDGTAVLPRNERRLVVAAAAGVALLWGRQELARAVAPDVSTFLLIGYFAATGIGAIALGRARHAPAARQVGLALALYAALKALLQASAFTAVGLRVASYLVVGGFLLGVGYWYRAAGSRRAAPPVSPSLPA